MKDHCYHHVFGDWYTHPEIVDVMGRTCVVCGYAEMRVLPPDVRGQAREMTWEERRYPFSRREYEE